MLWERVNLPAATNLSVPYRSDFELLNHCPRRLFVDPLLSQSLRPHRHFSPMLSLFATFTNCSHLTYYPASDKWMPENECLQTPANERLQVSPCKWVPASECLRMPTSESLQMNAYFSGKPPFPEHPRRSSKQSIAAHDSTSKKFVRLKIQKKKISFSKLLSVRFRSLLESRGESFDGLQSLRSLRQSSTVLSNFPKLADLNRTGTRKIWSDFTKIFSTIWKRVLEKSKSQKAIFQAKSSKV